MANDTILTNDVIAEKALPYFINNCKMLRLANRDYEKEYQRELNGYQFGETIRIKKPSYYSVTTGAIANPQPIEEFTDSITVNQQLNVAFDPSSAQLTLDLREMDMYEERVIMPAAIGLANTVDANCIQEMSSTLYNGMSSLGTGVSSFAAFNNTQAAMYKRAMPKPYFALMNVDDGTTLQNALQNSFNTTLNSEISIEGLLGKLAGIEVYNDQNMISHTNGINSGTPLVNAASQTGSSIVTDGWTATQTGILKEGDLITFASVYAVNPIPPNLVIGTGTGNLQVFRVTADVNSDGGGNATIPIFPAITVTGIRKTASNSPANNAVITVLGNLAASNTFAENFMMSRAAMTLAIVPMHRPPGAVKVGQYTDKDTGISLRVIDGYDPITDKEIKRLDILFGRKSFPQYAIKF